jgi:hypothetical protein
MIIQGINGKDGVGKGINRKLKIRITPKWTGFETGIG